MTQQLSSVMNRTMMFQLDTEGLLFPLEDYSIHDLYDDRKFEDVKFGDLDLIFSRNSRNTTLRDLIAAG